jgi:hypothetical protein
MRTLWHAGCLDAETKKTEMGYKRWRTEFSWVLDRDVFKSSQRISDSYAKYYHVVMGHELHAWESFSTASRFVDKVSSPVSNRYLRFGHLPPNLLSFNHRDEFFEKGLSVYEACLIDGLLVPVTFRMRDEGCEGISAGRPCYEIIGDVVGQGSDGEPVLANPEVVGVCEPIVVHDTVIGWKTHPGLITQLEEWYK